jgi:hypothetical protein
MPLFLIANRFARRLKRFKEIVLLLTAVVIVLLGASLFSLTQHVSIGTALYWASRPPRPSATAMSFRTTRSAGSSPPS